MIKVNISGSEYVNVPANYISSCCTSSRGTIFTRGADIEQCKVSDDNNDDEDDDDDHNNNNNVQTYLKMEAKYSRLYGAIIYKPHIDLHRR
jgi:hypothetical protein